MSGITSIIPRPLRDIVEARADIQNTYKCYQSAEPGSFATAAFGIFGGGAFLQAPGERIIKALLRTTLAAASIFTVYRLGGSLPVAGAIGALISLPAVMIASGSLVLYHGSIAIIAALATGSFKALGFGLAAMAGGWLALEYHDAIPYIGPFGIAENTIFKEMANSYAVSVARKFT